MEKTELAKGFNRVEIYNDYAKWINSTKIQLVELLKQLKQEGNSIIGYGASGRGTTIMNFCDIDDRFLDYVVDDAPAKHGFYTPGTHLPIKPWEYTEQTKFPDYAVLFAWAFTDEVLKKRKDYLKSGGKFIIPLPEVRVVSDVP